VPKRKLFAELREGFDALAAARMSKKTLRTTEVTLKPAVEISADELRAIREKLNLSRPVFAGYLRTNPRTLENWEQGRAKPNAQAALLIHLVSFGKRGSISTSLSVNDVGLDGLRKRSL